jgi:hypothetical protein
MGVSVPYTYTNAKSEYLGLRSGPNTLGVEDATYIIVEKEKPPLRGMVGGSQFLLIHERRLVRRVFRSQVTEEHLDQNRDPSVRGVSRDNFVQCRLPLGFLLLGHQQALVNCCCHPLYTFHSKSAMIAAGHETVTMDLTHPEIPRVYLSADHAIGCQ